MSFRCRVKLTVWYLKHGTPSADVCNTEQLHCETEMCTITYDNDESATIDMDDWFMVRISKLRAILHGEDGKPDFRVADGYRYELALSAVDGTSTWPPLHTGDSSLGRDASGVEVVVWIDTAGLRTPSAPQHKAFIRPAGVIKNSVNLSVVADCSWWNPAKRLLLRQQKPQRLPTPSSDGRDSETASNSILVTLTSYLFLAPVKNGRSWFGPPDPKGQHAFTITGVACCLCDGRQFQDVKYLHFHFVTAHALFYFKVTTRKPQGLRSGDQYADRYIQVVVDLASVTVHGRASDHTPDPRIMTWVRPTKEFNLNRILRGDWSWLNEKKGTVGPNRHGTSPDSPESDETKRKYDWNDIHDVTRREKRRFLVKKPRHTEKGLVYVRTASKRYIEVGEVLSDSDDDVDEEWLLRKHEEVCTNLVVGVISRGFLSNGSMGCWQISNSPKLSFNRRPGCDRQTVK